MENKKIIARLYDSAFSCIVIYSFDLDNDKIEHSYLLNGKRIKNISKSKIRYNKKGNIYFNVSGIRYYLTDFTREEF